MKLTFVVSTGDMLRKTNRAEIQERRQDKINGSDGVSARHWSNRRIPFDTGGLSEHMTILLSTLSNN